MLLHSLGALIDASHGSPDVRRLAELHAADKQRLAGTSLAFAASELTWGLLADADAAADEDALEAEVRRSPTLAMPRAQFSAQDLPGTLGQSATCGWRHGTLRSLSPRPTPT